MKRLSADALERARASRRKSTAKGKQKAIDAGKCSTCWQRKPKKGMKTCKICQEKYREKYRATKKASLARIKARRAVLRDTVFDAYGGPKCKCCEEHHIEFLTIDHVNGGGSTHRKEIGQGGTALHRWLIRNNFPPGFQVLCWNCNFATHAHKKCPHKRRKR